MCNAQDYKTAAAKLETLIEKPKKTLFSEIKSSQSTNSLKASSSNTIDETIDKKESNQL